MNPEEKCPECGEPLEFYSGSCYMGDYEGLLCTAKCGYNTIVEVAPPAWIRLEGLSEREFYEQEVLGLGQRDEYGSL